MITQTIRKHSQWLVPTAMVLTLASVFIARTAFARITFNTIDPVATVSDSGRRVVVTGPIAVGPVPGERCFMQVRVTQRTTGALAEGRLLFTGTGETNQWKVTVRAQGRARFEEGAATATAVARTYDHGHATTRISGW